MNLLAIDTSTEHLSIALQRRGVATAWQFNGAGGARSSTQLIPQIQQLMAQAELRYEQLDAIAFGAGPGAFTGLRTACAVAQGLAFGAAIPVLPVDTLLAVAEDARWQLQSTGPLAVTALLDARMDELYAAHYFYENGLWRQLKGWRLIQPEMLEWDGACLLAGNVFATYVGRLPPAGRLQLTALPLAAALLRLAPALLAAGGAVPAAQALPHYIREKVAQTTLERQALKDATAP